MSDYDGYDWYLKLYAAAAKVGVAAIVLAPILALWWLFG